MEEKTFPKVLANWLLNDFTGMCKKYKLTPQTCGITPEEFGLIIFMHYNEIFDKRQTKEILQNRLDELHGASAGNRTQA